jgi:hypothetical protein
MQGVSQDRWQSMCQGGIVSVDHPYLVHECDYTPLAVVSRARKTLRVSTTTGIAQIPAVSSKEGAVIGAVLIPSRSLLTSDTYE